MIGVEDKTALMFHSKLGLLSISSLPLNPSSDPTGPGRETAISGQHTRGLAGSARFRSWQENVLNLHIIEKKGILNIIKNRQDEVVSTN